MADDRRTKVAILIDGGHLRKCAERAGFKYTPNFIKALAERCANPDEQVIRVLYYDCAPYNGTVSLPVSGAAKEFNASAAWLDDLARRRLFAVRLGVLKFRGWRPKNIPIAGRELRDSDFKAVFEQKGVDMRIGLDIATIIKNRVVERVIIVGADTDLIPAMKHGRIEGLQIVGILLPNHRTSWEFLAHMDLPRRIHWPGAAKPVRAEKDLALEGEAPEG